MVMSEWEVIFRLILALIYGGLVGLERQRHGRPAGLRTNILVCLGSAAIIIAFQKLSATLQPGSEPFIRMDPARAAAGIITGIGFLGAGTIIKGKNFVLGLTTAASIWVVSAIGITLGLGHYLISAEVTALVLLTLFIFDKIPSISRHKRYKAICVAGEGGTELYERVRSQLCGLGLTVKGYKLETQPGDGATTMNFTVKFLDDTVGPRTIDAISRLTGVTKVSWG